MNLSMLDARHRKTLRLPGYDYGQNGAYFITIVTQGRKYLFGEVVDGEMILNDIGKMVEETWLKIPDHFDGVITDTFVIMPNHVHGIIEIERDDERSGVVATHASPLPLHFNGPVPGSIGAIVGSFKSAVTKRFHEMAKTPEIPLWQRNYHEHIIRDESDHRSIYDYIITNPLNWEKDTER